MNIRETKEMPRKFWNILCENDVNPNNYILMKSDYDSFTIKDKRTGKVLLPIRF